MSRQSRQAKPRTSLAAGPKTTRGRAKGRQSAPSDDPAAEARAWLRDVYQGDQVKQLTLRSLVTGVIIGAVMSVSNLYVGLKTGWSLGVTITACIIAYAVFSLLERLIPAYRRNPFTILENYTMSSAASAAGFTASAGLVSAFPALYLTTGRILTWWEMMGWLAAVSSLGVFLAVPLKRQLINLEKLPFPSGIATAETLRSMHVHGGEAIRKARCLIGSAGIGAVIAFWRDGLTSIAPAVGRLFGQPGLAKRVADAALPETLPLGPGLGSLLERLTFGFEGSSIMIAAGAIMGLRVGASLLLGAVIYYGFLGQYLVSAGIAEPGYRGLVSWTLWPATALMVSASMTSFALRWRTISRAIGQVALALRGGRARGDDPLKDIEVPTSWFVVGVLASGGACIFLGHAWFGISWWMGLLAVLATSVLSVVAARATGETDVTPIGAMGKITQLIYSVVAPSNITTNLMTASITAGAASHSADLLTDLKAGYLLGGHPRRQTLAQLIGMVAGCVLCVPVYTLVVDPAKLGSAEMPAPAAKVWASVAKMLASGLAALPPGAVPAMIVAAVLGVALALGDEFLPARWRRFWPSATGLGIAGVIPAFNSVSMFIGAAVAAWFMRAKPKAADDYLVAGASGLIAGESLMGVAIILGTQGGGMIQALFRALGW